MHQQPCSLLGTGSHAHWQPCSLAAMLTGSHAHWQPCSLAAMLTGSHAHWEACSLLGIAYAGTKSQQCRGSRNTICERSSHILRCSMSTGMQWEGSKGILTGIVAAAKPPTGNPSPEVAHWESQPQGGPLGTPAPRWSTGNPSPEVAHWEPQP